MQGISPTEAAIPLTPEPRNLIARHCDCCNIMETSAAKPWRFSAEIPINRPTNR